MRKLLSIPNLQEKAWRLYSKHRRSTAADFQGYVTCYTCGKYMQWKEADLGHFKHNKLDFDKRNTRIQCTHCNTFQGGKLDVYAIKLIEEIGFQEVKSLERDAARFERYTRQELDEIIKIYGF